MKYLVLHYIPHKRGMLTPGEIVDDLPEEVTGRLLEKGAIREADEPKAEEQPAKPTKAQKAPKAPRAPKPEKAEEPKEEEAEEAEEADAEEEDDVADLEIDPMEAVVAAEAPKKKPSRKGRKES